MRDHHHHDRGCFGARGMRGGPRGERGERHPGEGWGRHGWGGREGGRRHGGGRMFGHGALKWVLLSLIKEKPTHGYDLIKLLESRVGGAYAPSPGVVYPTLTLLEEMGALTSEMDGGKKRYAITPEGEAMLVENAEAVAEGEAAFARFGGRSMRPDAIEAAVGSLRGALRERLGGEPAPSEAEIAVIAEAIEAAAAAILKR